MRIAIPDHNKRVSPAFGRIQHILTVHIETGEGVARTEHDVTTLSPWHRTLTRFYAHVVRVRCSGRSSCCQTVGDQDVVCGCGVGKW